jgi:hypothetical protein
VTSSLAASDEPDCGVTRRTSFVNASPSLMGSMQSVMRKRIIYRSARGLAGVAALLLGVERYRSYEEG